MPSSRTQGIHIGLNRVDPTHYDGWTGELFGCENDARAMQGITASLGTPSSLLLTSQATSVAVLERLDAAAAELYPGDLLVVTYSGHGGQVPDKSGDEDQASFDFKDETWVLFDRQLVDDELYAAWGQFRAGVRVFVLSDSCHSGSVVREAHRGPIAGIEGFERTKNLPLSVAHATYEHNKGLYDGLQQKYPQGDLVGVGAHVLLISGCQDDQLSRDGDDNGLFTMRLLEIWNEGLFQGTYRDFHSAISERMPDIQTPNYFLTGMPSPTFEAQRPFAI